MNLHKNCKDANLHVSPERGKAVMWYNHHVDTTSGWLGHIERLSWHGACPVQTGEKWIGNFWIGVTDHKDFDMTPIEDLKPAEGVPMFYF